MEEIKGKGFVIKDKRFFATKEEKKEEKKDEDKSQERRVPLPEVTFNGLIFSLSSSALIYLGEIPDPVTKKKVKDLELAKHTIDTIAMLKEKTKGNLTEEEEKFIESVLVDLKWRYVKAVGL